MGVLLSTAAQNMDADIAPVFAKRLVSNYDTNLLTTMLILEEIAGFSAVLHR